MKNLNETLLAANIKKHAANHFENQKIFGSACCLVQEDGTTHTHCFGHTSPGGSTPVTDRTIFRLASMTKPVTAFAALLLVDRGLLALDDPVEKHIPAFAGVHLTVLQEDGSIADLGPAKQTVTIRHLLTHTSGISDAPAKMQARTPQEFATVRDNVNFLAKAGLDYEPGSRTQYSGTSAFDVLVQIIENVSGVDYPTFLQNEIFSPCGMEDTTFTPTPDQWARMIAMHDQADGRNAIGKTVENCVFYSFPCTHFLGGAGLVSTLRDYTAFAHMLLKGGVSPAGRLLSEETFRQMCTPQVPESIMPGNERWGLGVRVITRSEYKFLPVGTFGWSGAYGTHFWVDPENGVAAVYMRNSLFDGGSGSKASYEFEQAVHTAFVGEDQ